MTSTAGLERLEITEMAKTYADGWVAATSKGTGLVHLPAQSRYGDTKNTRIDYVWYSKGATALAVTRAEVFDTISMRHFRSPCGDGDSQRQLALLEVSPLNAGSLPDRSATSACPAQRLFGSPSVAHAHPAPASEVSDRPSAGERLLRGTKAQSSASKLSAASPRQALVTIRRSSRGTLPKKKRGTPRMCGTCEKSRSVLSGDCMSIHASR